MGWFPFGSTQVWFMGSMFRPSCKFLSMALVKTFLVWINKTKYPPKCIKVP